MDPVGHDYPCTGYERATFARLLKVSAISGELTTSDCKDGSVLLVAPLRPNR